MSLSQQSTKKKSLVHFLTASLTAVLFLSSLTISSVVFLVLYQRSASQFEERSDEALIQLSNSLESYLWHMEEGSVISLCETFSRLDVVGYIKVSDHRGNTIYEHGEVGGDTIIKEATVRYEDVDVGTIELGLTPATFREKVFETTWVSLLSLLSVILILGVFTKLVLDRTLRTPLGHLIDRIEAMARGRYAGDDGEEPYAEMQVILSKFNEMARQVRSREDELRISEQKYRSLFETSIEGIVAIDVDFRISMVNSVTAEMLGYSESEMAGMPVAEIIHEEEREEVTREAAKRRAGESARYERRLTRKDGSTVFVIMSSTPQFNEHGEFIGSFAMVTNITDLRNAQAELKLAYDQMEQRVIERTEELNKTNRLLKSEIHIRKQTEKQITEAKESAEKATKAKSEFLANMSHEIRTPMNAIIGMTHLANMTDLTPVQKDYLNKIDISARSLLGIINDILDMSKVEAGMLNIELVGFKLDHVLEQLTTIVSPRANEKKLEFLINVGKDVPTSLVGDSMRLSQILINLCNNAVKFTDNGSVVVGIEALMTTASDVRLRFTVKDDGIGIESEKIEELFKPFTQADASTTRKYGGSGLGLHLCNRLVNLMGGTIGVESEVGSGSLFWFEITFPLDEGMNGRTALPAELQGKRTLVVDDNPTSRIILKGMLEQMGLAVDLAESGGEALDSLRKSPEGYDLLVVDWRMPEMDGVETAEAVLADPDIPVKPPMLMVSAYGNATLVKKTNELGFKGLLFKPVNQSFLFNLVVEVLGKDMVTMSFDANAGTSPEELGGVRVLLVEDNAINRQVAHEILAAGGIETFEAFNGREAIEFLNENEVDLVLMDIQMPVMDGHEATQEIRRQGRFRDLPIIAMTAHAMVEDIEKSRRYGMNDHIAKPFDPDDLFRMLGRWTQKKAGCGGIKVDDRPAGDDVALPESLEGIDVALGLKRARGNKILYRNLLILLDEKYADAADRIEAFMEAGKREEGMHLAHSVKGTSGMLGANRLFEAASRLEAVLDRDPDSDVADELDDFRAELQVVIGSIAEVKAVSDETALGHVEEIADNETLRAALEALEKPLSRGAPMECREGADGLRSLGWPSGLEPDASQLLKFISEYDFKKALALIDAMKARL
ncbi:MAG: response regulator [Desulfovibrionaceae bacterium]|nr:response regulator [Desulfovibrionaceae bacterium]